MTDVKPAPKRAKRPKAKIASEPVEVASNPAEASPAEPDPASPPIPCMTDKEAALFRKYVAGARHYLEFGCGGSTRMAAELKAPMITSVDSDPDWIDKCRGIAELRDLDVVFHPIDIGPVRHWGRPADKTHAVKWPRYYTEVWKTLRSPPDVVLIDGRWRVACTLQTLLNVGPETTILLHDFWTRPRYMAVLNFLDFVDAVDSLAVMRPRKDIDWRALALLQSRHVMDYR